MKVIFAEARTETNISSLAKKLTLLNYKKIGLVATVQHLDSLKQLKEILQKAGKHILMSKGPRCKYEGQVLGCDVGAAKGAEAYIFLGTGMFHPLAIATETNKPVFVANPFTNSIEQVSESEVRRYLTKKAQNISKVKSAKVIGILVTVKPGQNQLKVAQALAKRLEKAGKKVFIFLGDTVDLSSLRNFSEVEAWINTCCPRMSEDTELIGRPIANLSEL